MLLLYSITINPRYESVREQRPRRRCLMTDFHKLFMVKINKMIKKKTGANFLVVYVIYGRFVYRWKVRSGIEMRNIHNLVNIHDIVYH